MSFLRTRIALVAIASQILSVTSAYAISFPDVPSSNLFQGEIETLATKGIVKGNPDGTFQPGKTVNRAEMLTMLYRAYNKTPATPTSACFKDVGTGDWYSAVVCDAANNGYVGGYPDGLFRPGNSVNRVEALKMIHTVFGFSADAGFSTSPLTAYTDVSLTAWYAPYMASGFARSILPVKGQSGNKFVPDGVLTRAEAAAYIFNALGLTVQTASSSSQSSTTTQRSSSSSSSSTTSNPIINVDIPFGDDGVFNGKETKVYSMNVTAPVVINVKASVNPGSGAAGLTCRLYKLNTSGFALEYYLGHINGNICTMKVALGTGEHQLQVRPNASNATLDLDVNISTSDGNDGFREAKRLSKATPKTGYLQQTDYAEWYYFTLATPQTMSVDLSAGDTVRCLIYPMGDVDIYGFTGPECNQTYEFPAGTYYIGVQRQNGRAPQKESFTLQYK